MRCAFQIQLRQGTLTTVVPERKFGTFLTMLELSALGKYDPAALDINLTDTAPLHDIQPNIRTLKHGCINLSLPQGLQVIVCVISSLFVDLGTRS